MVDFVTALGQVAPGLKLHESGEPLLEDLRALPAELIIKAVGKLKVLNPFFLF